MLIVARKTARNYVEVNELGRLGVVRVRINRRGDFHTIFFNMKRISIALTTNDNFGSVRTNFGFHCNF